MHQQADHERTFNCEFGVGHEKTISWYEINPFDNKKDLLTLGEESLAGRKISGNKIWRNWREFNLADSKYL